MTAKINLGRITGILYLLIIIFGFIAQIFVRDRLVDYENASITAKNILNSEFWYRFGFVSELLMLLCDVGVTTFLFILLKETSKNLSLLSTAFRFSSITILGITALTHYAALPFLTGSEYLTPFNSNQTAALALFSIKLHGVGYNISLLFFGAHLIILGYLVYISDLFKRFLGILLLIGGICYITNSFVWFLFPSLVRFIYPGILIPCVIGELTFCIILILKGAKVQEHL
jgi:hypothetical protein